MFSLEKLRGILLPFPTPFDQNGELDIRALVSNIEKWKQTGVQGFVALGSTGERVHLNERECLEVIEAARTAIPLDSILIAGAGQAGTRTTISEVGSMARAGADAALVITPHFYRGAMTQEALAEFYTAVADASPVPLILYSMPALTGIAIAPETVARLCSHENIKGIKDSSGDVINFTETLRLVPENFAVLTGNGAMLYAAISAGATGAILAAGCAMPRAAIEIYSAVEAGDHERARRLQQRFTPLARAVTARFGIGGLKAALDMLGYAGGCEVRAPLKKANEEARREIAHLIKESAFFDEEEMVGTDEQHLAGALTK